MSQEIKNPQNNASQFHLYPRTNHTTILIFTYQHISSNATITYTMRCEFRLCPATPYFSIWEVRADWQPALQDQPLRSLGQFLALASWDAVCTTHLLVTGNKFDYIKFHSSSCRIHLPLNEHLTVYSIHALFNRIRMCKSFSIHSHNFSVPDNSTQAYQ